MQTAHAHSPVAIVDACGHPCPAPVIAVRRQVRNIVAGDVLLLLADCLRTTEELDTWARTTGNELLHIEKMDERRRGYYIRKGFRRTIRRVVDTRGSRCQTPVVEAGRALRRLQSGDVIRLISDCPHARQDIEAWIGSTGHILLDAVQNLHGELHCHVQKR